MPDEPRGLPWRTGSYRGNAYATGRILAREGHTHESMVERLLSNRGLHLDRNIPGDRATAVNAATYGLQMHHRLEGAQNALSWSLGTLPERTHLAMELPSEYLYYVRLIGSTGVAGQEEYRDVPIYSPVRLSYRAALEKAMDMYHEHADRNTTFKFSDAVTDISGSLLLHARKR